MQGYAVLNSETGKILVHDTRRDGWLNNDYVTAMLPGDDFKGYVGTYGGALAMPEASTNSDVAQDNLQTNAPSTTFRMLKPMPFVPARPMPFILARIGGRRAIGWGVMAGSTQS